MTLLVIGPIVSQVYVRPCYQKRGGPLVVYPATGLYQFSGGNPAELYWSRWLPNYAGVFEWSHVSVKHRTLHPHYSFWVFSVCLIAQGRHIPHDNLWKSRSKYPFLHHWLSSKNHDCRTLIQYITKKKMIDNVLIKRSPFTCYVLYPSLSIFHIHLNIPQGCACHINYLFEFFL